MTKHGTTFCRIVKVTTRTDATGNEKWVLTHICGEIEERIRRKRGTRTERKAPNKVKCVISEDRAGLLCVEYRAADRSGRSEMWMMYVGLREQFEAIDREGEVAS